MTKRKVMAKPEFEAMLKQAREHNALMDEVERENGFMPPGGCSFGVLAATVESAVKAGMLTRDWSCVAEGYVMLVDDLLPQLRRFDKQWERVYPQGRTQ